MGTLSKSRDRTFLNNAGAVRSVGSRTTDDACILQETDIGFAEHSSQLHGLLEVVGTQEPACAIEAVPIKEERYFARVVHRNHDPGFGFSCCLAGVEMRIERFFPTAVLRNFMPNNHVNHAWSSKW